MGGSKFQLNQFSRFVISSSSVDLRAFYAVVLLLRCVTECGWKYATSAMISHTVRKGVNLCGLWYVRACGTGIPFFFWLVIL